MKAKFLSFFAMLYIAIAAHAYNPVLTNGSKAWSLHSTCDNSSIEQTQDGNTTINGTTYNTVYAGSPEAKAIREDISLQRLYMYVPEFQHEVVLFDFSILSKLTQTITEQKAVTYELQDASIVNNRKVMDMHIIIDEGSNSWSYMDTWIEGVGGKYGVCEQPWMANEMDECKWPVLVCVSTSQAVLYRSDYADIYPCSDIVCYDCADVKNTSINISNAPERVIETHRLYIRLSDGTTYDAQGKKVK